MEHGRLEALDENMEEKRARLEERLAKATFIKNVKIFDGLSDDLLTGLDVIIEGNKIRKILPSNESEKKLKALFPDQQFEDVFGNVFDGNGGTLMPGLMDVHQHITFPAAYPKLQVDVDWMWIAACSANEAERMLMRGFTTIRDVGGPAIGLGRAIDEGRSRGPRIYASGPICTQTCGHGDMRIYAQPHPNMPGNKPNIMETDYAFVCDGVSEVLRGAREALRRGAVFVKMTVGGGASSPYDPLHTVQYTVDEIRAGVQAAKDWGTYVSVHSYNDESIRRSLEAGVMSIEHGTLMTDDMMKRIKDEDAWLVPQARLFTVSKADEDYFRSFGPTTLPKVKQIEVKMKKSMESAVKHKVKIAYGTDLFGNSASYAKQSEDLAARLPWFTPAEILKQATSQAGELLTMSGPLNPYPEGKLGVIEEEAYADLLIVDGNPLKNIKLLESSGKTLKLIMKDGVVYKNTLS